jgi:ribosomal protein S27AE
MKCANPDCNRGIGLIAYHRGWSSKRRYCSKRCRDSFLAERLNRPQQERCSMTYFEWLFLQADKNPQPKLMPVRIRAR